MKTVKALPIVILLLLSVWSPKTFASHLLGGEIVWECLPSGQYRFTLTLYRDCTGIPQSSTTEQLVSTAGGNITCTKIQTNYINAECNPPTCIGATVPYQGAIEEHIYRSAPVTLTGTPPAAGWTFSWGTCCRPAGVTNLTGSSGLSYTLRAHMYPYVPPGGGAALNANPCYDNSPSFLEAPNVTVCTGAYAEFLSLGYDQDLDSLHYSYAQTLGTNLSTPITQYAAGYSWSAPFPASAGAVLDPELGHNAILQFLNKRQICLVWSC